MAGQRFIRPAGVLLRLISLVVLAAVAAACALQPRESTSGCETRFIQNDHLIAAANAGDEGPARISGFPFLRTSRLLASFRDELDGPKQLKAWVRALADLDARARSLELQNAGRPELAAGLDQCRAQLVQEVLQDPDRLNRLRRNARVPDDYVTAWQILGLAPLTSLPVSAGIARWHRETRSTFDTPLTRLPFQGHLVRLSSGRQSPPLAQRLPLDALGIPRPDAQTLSLLFDRHAPIWELEQLDENDRIGTAVWRDQPAIDTREATEYRRVSYTRFGNRVLLQLNYVIWFPARPGDDIYAGAIDGINWRVTLGPDGEPWLYDSIHNCGCYHLFFPSATLRLRHPLPVGEPPLVPQTAPEGTPVIRIENGRHFIQRLYRDEGGQAPAPLATVPYDRLRSLSGPDGSRHSFFGDHGLVAGSERPERFLLWPMGIRSPGAMRQWGRHATAFVGRRHFDDPFLFEQLFEEVTR